MFTAFAAGLLLGLSCGLAPGPLLALVIAQTLQHGTREGAKIALTPLVTDAPIILAALGFATLLGRMHFALGLVSLVGSAFVLLLAWQTARPARSEVMRGSEPPRSWFKGILTNALSPHPWLFWLTVGAATLARSMAQGWLTATAFLAGFYLALVGSKIGVAAVAGKSRDYLVGSGYRAVMFILAAMLAVFGVLLFREGLIHLALA